MDNMLGSIFITLAMVFAAGAALAGGLDAPAAPTASGSAMYTGEEIYNRLTTGAAGTKRSGPFAGPAAGPAAGGHTLNNIMAAAPAADNTNGATAADVLSGKTFWGLRTDGAWGLKTGSVPAGSNVTGPNGSLVINIPGGLYSNWHLVDLHFYGGQTATAVDSNLIAGNIRSGTAIFGVTGTLVPGVLAKRVVNKTGQTKCWDSAGKPLSSCAGTGQDGEFQYGNDPSIAPTYGSLTGAYNTPTLVSGARFTDNSDGTVTDNLTALIWLKNANCTDTVRGIAGGALTWADALIWSNYLASGACGLSDNSNAGDWRLPNINELHSLGPTWPPSSPFTGVQSWYWSSSTYANDTSQAWNVIMLSGNVFSDPKTLGHYVCPVRGGQ
jgi:hypothetical protein